MISNSCAVEMTYQQSHSSHSPPPPPWFLGRIHQGAEVREGKKRSDELQRARHILLWTRYYLRNHIPVQIGPYMSIWVLAQPSHPWICIGHHSHSQHNIKALIRSSRFEYDSTIDSLRALLNIYYNIYYIPITKSTKDVSLFNVILCHKGTPEKG